ncbi:hypothetical protein LTR84_009704 [Exophiala bonariae]|uniref:Phosphomevalonate kinase n=1 Tax=Exophiala bonariae TaxID=1690606 RepID=A0AAV9NMS0_9EURO|nr:hypothetical protein LTR84_009704 [Exophiala bonariae]
MSSQTVAVSAPGKVLFAGGFLVLDRKHTGLVFGLDARIHVHVDSWLQHPSALKGAHIQVRSPQFNEAQWLYSLSDAVGDHVAVNVAQVLDQDGFTSGSNKFVETTLRYVLSYLSHVTKDIYQSLSITILADDDYYSQSAGSSQPQEAKSDFTNFGVKLTEAHKTGLGSSAALVTALVASLLGFYSDGDVEETRQLQRTHNLAQAAHCAAQGKVGSGFDVAAAVYGSCLYRRFSPAVLESIGEPTSVGFSTRLRVCIDHLDLENSWDQEVVRQAVQVPNSLLLVMCDVDCGSETPGMVRKVLQWRKEQSEESNLLWNALQRGQEELCQQLRRLAEKEGILFDGYQELADTISTIRSLVREMSVASTVPIEPPVITELLDFCTSLPGVVGGVAPGAGGYDAVALLVKNDVEVVHDLQSRLEGWKSKDTSGTTIGKVRLLGVKQEKQGVRAESSVRYSGWL